jgi:hypothetical protein
LAVSKTLCFSFPVHVSVFCIFHILPFLFFCYFLWLFQVTGIA